MCNKPAGNRLNAVLQLKCPVCRRGKVFTNWFFNIAKFNKMNDHCPVCNHKFEIEPGYFYSAMFISYMFTVALCFLAGFGTYWLLDNPEPWVYTTAIISVIVLLAPLSFRYSRILTIHFVTDVKFDDSWK